MPKMGNMTSKSEHNSPPNIAESSKNGLLDSFLAEFDGLPATKRAYTSTLRAFLRFLRGREPTPELARRFIKAKARQGLKASSIARHAYALSTFFKWLGQPVRFDLPTIRRPAPRWLDDEEISRLFAACENSLERAMLAVLLDTAVRISELLKMTLDDIDWQEGFVKVIGKGAKEAWVPISNEALSALHEYLREHRITQGRLFPFSYSKAWRILRDLGNRAGIPNLHPHLTRHSRAAQLRREGLPLEDIKDLLRHANIQTTLIYATISPAELKRKVQTKPILPVH